MHRKFDVLSDPIFWIVMTIGILPVATAGTELVWLTY
jgi:hypothetical protein